MSKRSSEGGGVGVLIFSVFFLGALVPKPVWIVLGVVAGLAVVSWLVVRMANARAANRAAAEERARARDAECAAAAVRERAERERREQRHRIATLGKRNAGRIDVAMVAVRRVCASEAARAGWLGDVDFESDIATISDGFEKAFSLRREADALSALKNPGADDRRILAEAKSTADGLERAAIERAGLIGKCAREAELIDESLRTEREDTRIAERRAELHAKLSGMLYGVEATPAASGDDSAVAAVLARVRAYREIKDRIGVGRT